MSVPLVPDPLDRPPSILVIDDDDSMGALLLALLRTAGYEASRAVNGRAGIALAEEFRPDVILLDYQLPDQDGCAVCTELKSRLSTADTPVIFVTGSDRSDEAISRCFEAGGCDFINKPVNRVDLLARLKVVLRERALREAYRRLATEDPLTGVNNRRQFMLYVVEAVQASNAKHSQAVLLLCDLDRFKSINDRFGHDLGDEVIVTFSRLLGRFESSCCHVGRMGGDEFALILSGGTIAEGEALANRICNTFAAVVFDAETDPKQFTTTIGVSAYDGSGEKCDADSLLKHADVALYAAKSAGRNCVRAYWRLEPAKRQSLPPPEHRHSRSRGRAIKGRAYIGTGDAPNAGAGGAGPSEGAQGANPRSAASGRPSDEGKKTRKSPRSART